MLHYYASEGSYSKVQSLLDQGVDIDGKDSAGQTPLMLAAQKAHRKVVELLVNLGADILGLDDSGWSALHHASRGGSMEIVQCLVNKGVSLNAKNSECETPLMLAAKWAHREVVELLINSGADIHCCDDKSWTLLHFASDRGWVELVQCLVNKGIAIDVKNSNGDTPLMLAAQGLHRKILALLIKTRANIHCYVEVGKVECTLLSYASYWGFIEIVQLLLKENIDINARNCDGKTPLHFALEMNRINIVDYLLNKGADCNLSDSNGESPFHLLIRKKFRFVNLSDDSGESPTFCLIRSDKRYVETIKLCIEKGAYIKPNDYNILLKDPLYKRILQDVKLCSQAIINKFNNNDLPLLYKDTSARKLPHIEKMKIGNGSGAALEVEQAVTREIQAKGFCNLIEIVPLSLSILCIKSIEKSSSLESQNNSKRPGCNKQEYPSKKKCV